MVKMLLARFICIAASGPSQIRPHRAVLRLVAAVGRLPHSCGLWRRGDVGLDRRKPGAEVLEVGDDRELLCKHDLESPELHQLLVLCVCVCARVCMYVAHDCARSSVSLHSPLCAACLHGSVHGYQLLPARNRWVAVMACASSPSITKVRSYSYVAHQRARVAHTMLGRAPRGTGDRGRGRACPGSSRQAVAASRPRTPAAPDGPWHRTACLRA